jgi:hypothetical protein
MNCVGYDGNDIWCTKRAEYAIMRGFNTLNTDLMSPMYIRRLEKAGILGFSIKPHNGDYSTPKDLTSEDDIQTMHDTMNTLIEKITILRPYLDDDIKPIIDLLSSHYTKTYVRNKSHLPNYHLITSGEGFENLRKTELLYIIYDIRPKFVDDVSLENVYTQGYDTRVKTSHTKKMIISYRYRTTGSDIVKISSDVDDDDIALMLTIPDDIYIEPTSGNLQRDITFVSSNGMMLNDHKALTEIEKHEWYTRSGRR